MAKPRTHSKEFKLKVAISALKEDRTIAEICQEYKIASGQVYLWKSQLQQRGSEIFAQKSSSNNQQYEIDRLYKIIGQITAERDFLAKAFK